MTRRRLLLGTLLDRLAAIHRDRVLVDTGSSRLTYREAADRVARLAGGIASSPGFAVGGTVVVAVASSYDLLLLCVAACRAGGVAVPVNPQTRDEEVAYVIEDSGAALVVREADEVLGPRREPAAAGRPRDVAAIFYTSGTTGRPKGAELTHLGLLGQVAPAAVWPTGLRRDEAVVALPVAHIMGFQVLLGLAAAGIPTYFLPRFRPDLVLDAIERRRSTMFVGVPAMYRLLLEAGASDRDLRSVRVWASGADVLPPEIARRFQRMGATLTLPFGLSVGQAAFVEGYGMVEIGGGVAAKVAPFVPLPRGDFLGVPTPPNHFKVVNADDRQVGIGETGELLVKGPGLLKGYHGDAEATRAAVTEDGWLRTGDLARRGPLGLVFFAGRSKDVIKRGGYSVFAVEVERTLEAHPDVAEAAVVGLPDERLGEVPVAAVRVVPGSALTEEGLVRWAGEHLADYKVPVQVRMVEELPRTGTSKVKKNAMLGWFTPLVPPF